MRAIWGFYNIFATKSNFEIHKGFFFLASYTLWKAGFIPRRLTLHLPLSVSVTSPWPRTLKEKETRLKMFSHSLLIPVIWALSKAYTNELELMFLIKDLSLFSVSNLLWQSLCKSSLNIIILMEGHVSNFLSSYFTFDLLITIETPDVADCECLAGLYLTNSSES